MPRLQKHLAVLRRQCLHAGQLVRREYGRRRQRDRLQPELRELFTVLNMDVSRFVPFVAEEEEPLPLDPENGWRHATREYQFRPAR
jgi:hypothetical protein